MSDLVPLSEGPLSEQVKERKKEEVELGGARSIGSGAVQPLPRGLKPEGLKEEGLKTDTPP